MGIIAISLTNQQVKKLIWSKWMNILDHKLNSQLKRVLPSSKLCPDNAIHLALSSDQKMTFRNSTLGSTISFDDGHYKQYATNVLDEALAASSDNNGFDTGFISEISGYRRHSTSVPRSQAYFLFKNSRHTPIITTKG